MDIVTIQNRHGFLQNDGPVVQMLVNKMDRATGQLHAVFKRLFLRVHSRKSGQQRRMNVDNAIGKSPDEVRREEAHIAGQADQINLRLLQRRYNLSIVLFADSPFGRNQLSLQAAPLGRVKATSISAVRNDNRDFCVKLSALD